jgi:CubicO group peptidase (beta-lactamase class C family)
MYGYDVEQFLLRGKFTSLPGERYYYSSASTQLLGIVLHRALQKSALDVNLSQYLSKKIWQPLGMNDGALWHLDGAQKMELVFCCINTTARNFAKLGQLMLAKGRGPRGQIIAREFINTMLRPQSTAYFGHSIWLSEDASPQYFWLSGHLGQYIIVVPDENLVVVKLGEERKSRDFRNEDLPFLVQEAIRMSERL